MTRSRTLKGCSEGAAAVEFAIIAPLFIMTLLTLVAYGLYLSAAHSVQQITADAARTAVAGLTATERQQLVDQFIATSTLQYGLLQRDKLSVTVNTDASNSNQFTVAVTYDAKGLPIWSLYSFMMPGSTIKRFATIRLGGL